MTVPVNTQTHLPADPKNDSPYAVHAREERQRFFVGSLLKVDKHISYIYGLNDDKRTLAPGAKLVFAMDSLLKGWERWSDEGKIVERHIGRIVDNYRPPVRNELGYHDESQWRKFGNQPQDPWQFCNMIVVKEAGEDGRVFTFKSTSWGGREAVR